MPLRSMTCQPLPSRQTGVCSRQTTRRRQSTTAGTLSPLALVPLAIFSLLANAGAYFTALLLSSNRFFSAIVSLAYSSLLSMLIISLTIFIAIFPELVQDGCRNNMQRRRGPGALPLLIYYLVLPAFQLSSTNNVLPNINWLADHANRAWRSPLYRRCWWRGPTGERMQSTGMPALYAPPHKTIPVK